MKSPLIQEIDKKRQKCYPTVWFDRQLVFKFNYGDFEPGDSGASVVGKNGKALGTGCSGICEGGGVDPSMDGVAGLDGGTLATFEDDPLQETLRHMCQILEYRWEE
ncbi:hypothetical protein RhiirA4_485341 [Rhizophagus irregularis]|uniref:Uncharacterized protein n=1 Tax=Rhizophagus irregularis TaxID=588596 RepID=A0A2I1HPZ8_9GLOM|nr:hypothetical protein RhiirA4_485341 [Rhizophagus irregularis]